MTLDKLTHHSNLQPKSVGLFVTCLVDNLRPQIAEACVEVLESLGYKVEVPVTQSCCGQPAWNSGDEATAMKVARTFLDSFADCQAIIVPSGSCTGMITHHLPELCRRQDSVRLAEAEALAARTYELSQFLVKFHGEDSPHPVKDRLSHRLADLSDLADKERVRSWTYHDSCSSLRELGVREGPRTLLETALQSPPREMAGRDNCCGFGGLFCLKYDEISAKMVDGKLADAKATDAEILLAGDLGCLLNIVGRAKRQGQALRCYHYAEILAFGLSRPPIGDETKH